MFSGSIERDQWHKMGCKTPQGSFPFKKATFCAIYLQSLHLLTTITSGTINHAINIQSHDVVMNISTRGTVHF